MITTFTIIVMTVQSMVAYPFQGTKAECDMAAHKTESDMTSFGHPIWARCEPQGAHY